MPSAIPTRAYRSSASLRRTRGPLGFRFRACCASAALAAILLSPLSVTAQAAAAPSPTPAAGVPSVRDDVRKLHNAALDALKRGEFQAAYKGFLAAWSLQQIPQIAGNLARSEVALGKHRDAAEHLEYFLRLETRMLPAEKSDRQLQLTDAKRHIVTLRLRTQPDGAEAFIDGKRVDKPELEHDLFLDPGPHTLEARCEGRVATKTIDELAGAELAPITLEVLPPPPPIPAREPVAPEVRPFPTRTVILIGGGALALIGLGMGAATGAVALTKQADEDKCASETCFNSIERSRHPLAIASLAGFIVGGAAAVGTGIYFLVGTNRDGRNAATKLRIAPAGPGFLLTGSW